MGEIKNVNEILVGRPEGKRELRRPRHRWEDSIIKMFWRELICLLSLHVICIKTSVCPNITVVGNSVPILKHSQIQNNVSNKRIVGPS
jgi:hypothetical protein